VGRKNGELVLGRATASSGIVSTPIWRASPARLGLTRNTDRVKIERDLMTLVPKADVIFFSIAAILARPLRLPGGLPRCSGLPPEPAMPLAPPEAMILAERKTTAKKKKTREARRASTATRDSGQTSSSGSRSGGSSSGPRSN